MPGEPIYAHIVLDASMYSPTPVLQKPCSDGTHRWALPAERYCQCGEWEAYRDATSVLTWAKSEHDVKGRIYQGSPECNVEITDA